MSCEHPSMFMRIVRVSFKTARVVQFQSIVQFSHDLSSMCLRFLVWAAFQWIDLGVFANEWCWLGTAPSGVSSQWLIKEVATSVCIFLSLLYSSFSLLLVEHIIPVPRWSTYIPYCVLFNQGEAIFYIFSCVHVGVVWIRYPITINHSMILEFG